MMRDIEWVDGKDSQGKDIDKDGSDWFDRMEKYITKVSANGDFTSQIVEKLGMKQHGMQSEGEIKLNN